MSRYPENRFNQYHAHLYYDQNTLGQAEALIRQAASLDDIAIGHMHRRPVGPHPDWSCQISFASEQFDTVIPWLEQHRNGLNVLVHGVTDNDLLDHTEHAAWLGEARPLDISIFQS